MNCKQVQELLPLYAGGDLAKKRATLVTMHLQTCAACTRVADEYHQFVGWTEQVATPVFSESVYAGIRQRVLREIETEAVAPAWWSKSLFRPRLSWAIASVLVIALSLFAIYLIVKRRNDGQQLADKSPAKVQPETNERDSPRSPGDAGVKEQQQAGVSEPLRKRSRRNTVGAKPAAAMSSANSTLPEPTLFPPRDSDALVKTLRVEIQTKDPKIRIIWFVQPESKPAIPSSKGT